ncbi:3'-5' exonuclease [Alkalicoccobacillus gibsonii]|uniref:3'-5' exonuclease n=1 Tax=Alkalicoccobacillus gibsonii TaxID=79881 RepID=UPI0035110DB5
MYTIIDFETTGLDYKKEQVIEIGAIKLDKHFVPVSTINVLVQLNEGRSLPAKITEITGLEEKDLVNGVKDDYVALAMLEEFIGEDIVVAQFASFDLAFLSHVFKPEKFICTRSLSIILDPTEKASLKDLVPRYGATLDNHHRALADVEATADIFKAMMARCFLTDLYINRVMNVMVSGSRPLHYIPDNAILVDREGNQL